MDEARTAEVHPAAAPEWISQRAARELLHGAGLTTRQARRALGWGLAGNPLVTTTAHLFDRLAVQRLAEREPVDERALSEQCPNGVFVARLGEAPKPGEAITVQAAGAACAEEGWEMALEQRTFLRWQADLVRDRRLVTGPGPSWRFWQPLPG